MERREGYRRDRGGGRALRGAPRGRLGRRLGRQRQWPVRRAGVAAGLAYVEIAAGSTHTVACRSDGSAVAWGDNGAGQTNVPALPPGLVYIAVAAGGLHSAALRSDG